MFSYHNDPTLKSSFVAHVKGYELADKLAQGSYYDEEAQTYSSIGCYCTFFGLEPNDHEGLSRKLDVPVKLLHLNERIFERTFYSYSNAWPVRFAEAIPVGRDLSMVGPKLVHWMLGELPNWAELDANRDAEAIAVIAQVRGLYERWIAGDKPTKDEWKATRTDSEVRLLTAARINGGAAAARTARTVTAHAAYASDSYADAVDVYARAARATYHFEMMERIGDKLLELIQTA